MPQDYILYTWIYKSMLAGAENRASLVQAKVRNKNVKKNNSEKSVSGVSQAYVSVSGMKLITPPLNPLGWVPPGSCQRHWHVSIHGA